MVTRRQFLGGTAAVGVAWVTPTILVASLPASGAQLSGAVPESEVTPSVQRAQAEQAQQVAASGTLPFTGAPIEQQVAVAAAMIGAGMAIKHWAARGKSFPVR